MQALAYQTKPFNFFISASPLLAQSPDLAELIEKHRLLMRHASAEKLADPTVRHDDPVVSTYGNPEKNPTI